MKKLISTLSFLLLFAINHYAQDNHSLDLDGINDYVQVNDFALTGDFTISFWFKCNETSNASFEERMISFGPSTRLEIGIDSGTNELWIFDATASGTQSFGGDLRDGAWHHMALVKSFSQLSVYLDGEDVGFLVGLSSATFGEFCRLGAWTGGSSTSTFFNGQLDEARIWSVSKTADEIEDAMFCPLSGEEEDLIAYWDFDQGISGGNNSGETVLIDRSNNGREGTLSNLALDGDESNWIESNNADLVYLDPNITENGNDLTAVETGSNYQWLDCNNNLSPIDNETNQTFTASASGSYAVEISNGSCSVVSDCMDLIYTDIENVEDVASWNIYPNPAKEVLFIESESLTEVNISVSDVYGKILFTTTANDLVTDIDLSDFATGTYFVQIMEKERTLVQKFVKQ